MKKKIVLIFSVGIVGIISFLGFLGYDKRKEAAYLYDELIVKKKAAAVIRHTTEVEFESGGLALRGTLYTPQGEGRFPGIVLAHGGTRLGRNLALYRVLAHRLAERGYVVLSFDFRGYGQSEDPVTFNTPADLDFAEDVKQAVSYLLSVDIVDTSQIYLLGHSFGAGVVIPAGIQDTRVTRIVSIAPGRRTYELFWSPDAPAKHFPRERLAHDLELPQIRKLSRHFLYPILRSILIDVILDSPVHPAILLIDGGKEDERDLRFLRDIYGRMRPPKAYVTIPDADHYFGTRMDDSGIGNIVTYWPAIFDELLDTIDSWLRERDV